MAYDSTPRWSTARVASTRCEPSGRACAGAGGEEDRGRDDREGGSRAGERRLLARSRTPRPPMAPRLPTTRPSRSRCGSRAHVVARHATIAPARDLPGPGEGGVVGDGGRVGALPAGPGEAQHGDDARPVRAPPAVVVRRARRAHRDEGERQRAAARRGRTAPRPPATSSAAGATAACWRRSSRCRRRRSASWRRTGRPRRRRSATRSARALLRSSHDTTTVTASVVSAAGRMRRARRA